MYSVLWKCIVFDACHKVVTGEWELEGFTKKKLEVFDASPSPSPPPGKRRRASAAAATGQGASSANAAPCASSQMLSNTQCCVALIMGMVT